MTVTQLYSQAELDNAQTKAGGALVVVDFGADFCGPCKKLAPMFDAMAAKHTDVKFYKVIMETAKEFTHAVGISGFPTVGICY
jgi:thiol-disulfide isomerase/thioredoxin